MEYSQQNKKTATLQAFTAKTLTIFNTFNLTLTS